LVYSDTGLGHGGLVVKRARAAVYLVVVGDHSPGVGPEVLRGGGAAPGHHHGGGVDQALGARALQGEINGECGLSILNAGCRLCLSVCLLYTIHFFSSSRIFAIFLTAAHMYIGYVFTFKSPRCLHTC
jgi:hypothetical protein